MEHQPGADAGARPAHAHRRHSARLGRLRRRADRRCGGGRDPRWRRRGDPRRAAGGTGRNPGGGDRGGATRAVAVPVTVARAARPAGQRDDPREGAHPRAAALRGLGILRQAHARAPRGIHPPAESRHPHFRAGAERHLAGELRRAAGAVLTVGGRGIAVGGTAGVRRGSQVLRRCVSAVPLALARDPHADLPGDRDRPRGSCQGGQALRPGSAPARALPRYFPAAVPGGSGAHHAARCLGLFPGTHRHRRPVRRLRLDRGHHRAARHHTRPDDHVHRAVSPGAVGGVRHAGGGRRHVRRQPVPVDALRVPGNQRARVSRHRGARSASGGWRALRGRELQLSGSRGAGPRARHAAPDAGGQSRAGG